jgi:hypothetical protein
MELVCLFSSLQQGSEKRGYRSTGRTRVFFATDNNYLFNYALELYGLHDRASVSLKEYHGSKGFN